MVTYISSNTTSIKVPSKMGEKFYKVPGRKIPESVD